MEIVNLLKSEIQKAFSSLGVELSFNDIVIENSKTKEHGDYASNVALKYAAKLHMSPRDIATKISGLISNDSIEKIEIAGPGFINFFVKNDSLTSIVKKVIDLGDNFGRNEKKNKKICLEFVSANPTGELHVGHARGAAIGDSLARILIFDGYDVTREYYINDAGKQIDNLGLSIESRYLALFGIDKTMPEDGYYGDDVKVIASNIKEKYGDKYVQGNNLEFFKEEGMKLELDRIKQVLKEFGLVFDVFTSEKVIRSNNAVENEIKYLEKYTYKDEGALVLRTTDFLDDKDRVIVKSNGDYTYFLPDIVYHVNKLSRGFDHLIDVLGADHHGYINRMKSSLMMHGYDKDVLEITLIQMVRFIQNGVEVKASKRSGNAITLAELIEDIGKDATRYFFAMRNPSTQMDFDLSLAVEQSSNNPVYYAQYAHARLCSILESAKDIDLDISGKKLNENSELELLKFIATFNNVVSDASNEKAPFKITNYIHELAEKIHLFYTECRVIDRDNLEVTKSRLALVKACKIVMKNALDLIGVSAPEHM